MLEFPLRLEHRRQHRESQGTSPRVPDGVLNLDGRFELGRLQIVRDGAHVVLISMGSISVEAVAAADLLSSRGIEATVAIVSSFNPDASQDLSELLAAFRVAVSVEAQTISGGLAAFVAGVIASEHIDCRLYARAVRTSPDGTSGSQQDRWKTHGLDRESIAECAISALTGKGRAGGKEQ